MAGLDAEFAWHPSRRRNAESRELDRFALTKWLGWAADPAPRAATDERFLLSSTCSRHRTRKPGMNSFLDSQNAVGRVSRFM
jgi:hypothetical protein